MTGTHRVILGGTEAGLCGYLKAAKNTYVGCWKLWAWAKHEQNTFAAASLSARVFSVACAGVIFQTTASTAVDGHREIGTHTHFTTAQETMKLAPDNRIEGSQITRKKHANSRVTTAWGCETHSSTCFSVCSCLLRISPHFLGGLKPREEFTDNPLLKVLTLSECAQHFGDAVLYQAISHAINLKCQFTSKKQFIRGQKRTFDEVICC